MNRRKLLLKDYKFKESKHDRFGKRPAATAAEKIDERSTEADVSPFRRSIGLFVFFFFFYDRLRTLDLRFLLWMYLDLAKLLLERFRSARQKAITFFAAHLAESSLREELACGPVIELLHRSCNWLQSTERAARFPARAPCAGSQVGAEKFAWARNPTRYECPMIQNPREREREKERERERERERESKKTATWHHCKHTGMHDIDVSTEIDVQITVPIKV